MLRCKLLYYEKFLKIKSVMESFLNSHSVSKRDMLSLLGHLNFTLIIISQGYSFIYRLMNLAHSAEKLSDVVHLDQWFSKCGTRTTSGT